MSEVVNIEYSSLVFFAVLLFVPSAVFRWLGIGLELRVFTSFLRMGVQLGLVGLYLNFLFRLDNIWVNCLWVMVMIASANVAVIRQAGFRVRRMFFAVLPVFLISAVFMTCCFCLVLDKSVVLSARYLIPLLGMVLGNILKSNVVVLERFYSMLRLRYGEYMEYATFGAGRFEALKPFIADAYKAAISPHIATVATMGIVSLPGMMTGQILGGSSPLVAIKYQMMIMVAIFVSACVCVLLSILFSQKVAFDSAGRLREDIFKN